MFGFAPWSFPPIPGAVGPVGQQGAQGAKGDTGATGSQGSQGNAGAAGAQGPAGAQGSAGVNAYGPPVTRSLSLATAYQASDPTKPAVVTVMIDLSTSVSIGSVTQTVELIMGSTSAVASGTGTLADSWANALTVTLISITMAGRQKLTCQLPVGWFFAVRRTVGTGMSISSAFDQSVG